MTIGHRVRRAWLAVVVAVAGCAMPYTPPEHGPTASLTLVTKENWTVAAWLVPIEACERGAKPTSFGGVRAKSFILDEQLTRPVDASGPIALTVRAFHSYGSCKVAGVFQVQPGDNIEVEFVVRDRVCVIEARKAVPGASAIPSIPVQLQRAPQKCISEIN
jgi:hypothetical protein